MKKLILFATVFILCVCNNRAFANGGPVDWTKTTPTGGVTLKNEDNIRLEFETINIKLNHDLYTYSVEAAYHLSNDGPDKLIQFGVPLTWPSFLTDGKMYFDDEIPPNAEGLLWKNIQLVSGDIEVELNGNKISCTPVSREKYLDADVEVKHHEVSYKSFRINGWCVATLKIKGRDKSLLNMKYKAELYYMDSEYSKSALTRFSKRQLTYLFYPAGFWEGNVKKIDIQIDLGPYKDYVVFTNPDKAIRKESTIQWHLRDADFKSFKSLEVALSPTLLERRQLLLWNKNARVFQKMRLDVNASSTLKALRNIDYRPQNAVDGRGDTAWCEGAKSNGEGEWLEFRISDIREEQKKDYCRIEGIAISPGYLKSQASYINNGRVTKLSLSDCNNGISYIYNIPLEQDYLLAPYLIRSKYIGETHEKTLNFIKKQRCFMLKILEVEKGKFADTCISELAVVLNCG